MTTDKSGEKTVIVTPVFNKFELATKPFLDSLYKYTNPDLFDLILIDNGSEDKTTEYLKTFEEEHSNIKVIYNKENLGYSKANNQGITLALKSKCKYIGLLNNDILFTPEWLEKTLSVFELDLQLGMVAPRDAGRPKFFKKKLTSENYLENYKEYLQKFKEPFKYMLEPLFSCVIIKREVIEKIGLMDENFTPAFWEDQDYCLRALYSGFSLATSNISFVFHNHSTTSSGIKSEIYERNKQYFYKKHPLGKWIWEHKRSNIIRDIKNYIKESLE